MIEIKGLSGAPGRGFGKAIILENKKVSTERKTISDSCAEIHTLTNARNDYKRSLSALTESAESAKNKTEAGILNAYIEILDDDVFFNDVEKIIRQENVCASWAVEEKRRETAAKFSSVDDKYLKSRVDDINNICVGVMKKLQGISDNDSLTFAGNENFIVFAKDLTPADTVRFDRKYLKGMVTEKGGLTSHTVILAKALGIPTVVGTGPFPQGLFNEDSVLIDGTAGMVVVSPDDATRKAFETKCKENEKQQMLFYTCESRAAVTRDGFHIHVDINSGDKESIRTFNAGSCDGIGLFRTEFVYMGQSYYPSEELQFQIYKDMAVKAGEKELIIRTLDIGGDKQLGYMNLPKEANPFLGYRAIRICLDRTEIFKIQLKAILRAGVYGNVKIMFPMIANLEEVIRAKELLEEAKADLTKHNIKYKRDIPVGIMVETPAAALLSDKLAENVSFFSIGSNDLIQYITAADRTNERVQPVYNNHNISFLRAVKLISENAHRCNISVGICGETASEPSLIPLWCAMGIDELSVAPALVGRTKYLVGQMSRKELIPEMEKILSSGSIENCNHCLSRILESIDYEK